MWWLVFSDSDFTDCQFLNNETLSFTNIKNISDSVINSCEQILLHNEIFIKLLAEYPTSISGGMNANIRWEFNKNMIYYK